MGFINKSIVKLFPLVPRKIVRRFANKYIAGDKLSDAVELAKRLNDKGIMGTMDVLGENISTKEEAVVSRNECIEVIDAIDKNKLNSNISIKLTQMGLKIDLDFCLKNLEDIMDAAKSVNQFIRVDMEDSSCTKDTIKTFLSARDYYPRCGIVLQACLRRTYADVQELIKSHTNFRLCKGIYIEPVEIAYRKKEEVNEHYLKILRVMLESGSYVGIATHDDKLIEGAYKMIDELKKKRDEYEFQMLLGVRENLRDKIVKDGHRLRVYIPFGEHWYNYSLRRFQENPEVMSYVIKSVFTKN
ncbi:MAG: proline dehydrogenase family protein [Ignavibacteria bacterium]|jgi:proline dehydrogenase